MRNRTPDSSHRWYDELQSENTQALLDRLEAEMDKEEIEDTELVEAISEILDERIPAPASQETPEESLREFRAKFAPMLEADLEPEKNPHPFRRTVVRAALAACLCVVLIGVVAQASGIDLIGRFLEWREETFVLRGANHGGQMVLDNVPEGEFASLADAVAAYGVTDPVTPTWIPESFGIQYIRAKNLSHAIDLTARYVGENDHKVIVKVYISFDESDFDVYSEHSDIDATTYETNGIPCLISSNNSQYRATWIVDNCICSINGNLTEREIKQMIDSIFTEER